MAEQADKERDAKLLEIAKDELLLPTLETRKMDSLDFSDQAVWSIRKALELAYEAGQHAEAKKTAGVLGGLTGFVTDWRDTVKGGDRLEALEGWAREFVTEADALLGETEGGK